MTFFKFPRLLTRRTVNNKTKLELVRNQIDFFWSSRLRRSFQIYNFYCKLWDEKALREFLRHMRNNIVSSTSTCLNRTLSLSNFSSIATANFYFLPSDFSRLTGTRSECASTTRFKNSSMSLRGSSVLSRTPRWVKSRCSKTATREVTAANIRSTV